MALADPQTVTVSGNAKTLARTGASMGSFQTSDGEYSMFIKHDSSRRTRHIVQLRRNVIVSDPLVPAQNVPLSYSAHLTVDLPKQGVVAADVIALANALIAWATSATITKVVGSES